MELSRQARQVEASSLKRILPTNTLCNTVDELCVLCEVPGTEVTALKKGVKRQAERRIEGRPGLLQVAVKQIMQQYLTKGIYVSTPWTVLVFAAAESSGIFFASPEECISVLRGLVKRLEVAAEKVHVSKRELFLFQHIVNIFSLLGDHIDHIDDLQVCAQIHNPQRFLETVDLVGSGQSRVTPCRALQLSCYGSTNHIPFHILIQLVTSDKLARLDDVIELMRNKRVGKAEVETLIKRPELLIPCKTINEVATKLC